MINYVLNQEVRNNFSAFINNLLKNKFTLLGFVFVVFGVAVVISPIEVRCEAGGWILEHSILIGFQSLSS